MSFKQFNIYNRVHAPDYANTGAKSYGTNSFTTTEVVVGTSSRNSHEFLKHETKKIVNDDLIMLRPGDGISPMKVNNFIGKVTSKNLKSGSKLKLTDLK